MKIRELFESFSPTDKEGDLTEKAEYDICEDLVFFMNNDDEFYRRHYYPHLINCKNAIKRGHDIKAEAFRSVVKKAYECYLEEFNEEILPESLSEQDFSSICEKIKEEEVKNIKNKMY